MAKKILVFLVIFLAGCSTYRSSLDVSASGENVRYGLVSVKKGSIKIQKRRVSEQSEKQYQEKYISCLSELNQCVSEGEK